MDKKGDIRTFWVKYVNQCELLLLVVEDDVWHPYQFWWNSYRRHIVIVRWPPAKFIVIPLLLEGNIRVIDAIDCKPQLKIKEEEERCFLTCFSHTLVVIIWFFSSYRQIFSSDSKLLHLNIFCSFFASISGCEMLRFFFFFQQGRVEGA